MQVMHESPDKIKFIQRKRKTRQRWNRKNLNGTSKELGKRIEDKQSNRVRGRIHRRKVEKIERQQESAEDIASMAAGEIIIPLGHHG